MEESNNLSKSPEKNVQQEKKGIITNETFINLLKDYTFYYTDEELKEALKIEIFSNSNYQKIKNIFSLLSPRKENKINFSIINQIENLQIKDKLKLKSKYRTGKKNKIAENVFDSKITEKMLKKQNLNNKKNFKNIKKFVNAKEFSFYSGFHKLRKKYDNYILEELNKFTKLQSMRQKKTSQVKLNHERILESLLFERENFMENFKQKKLDDVFLWDEINNFKERKRFNKEIVKNKETNEDFQKYFGNIFENFI